jgi:serine/threonine-protein kinase HipA
LKSDDGQWQPAPFYEHATAFSGYGKAPPIKVMQKLAASAGFANWNEAKQVVKEVSEALSQFAHLAGQQGLSKATVSAINKTLTQRRQENAVLFQ